MIKRMNWIFGENSHSNNKRTRKNKRNPTKFETKIF